MSKSKLRIPHLTDEHRATFPAWIEEWTGIGRSTEPIDRENTLRGMRLAYAAAKLPPPMVFFGVSPIGGVVMRHLIREYTKNRAGVGDGVWDGVRDGVWAGVGDGVWGRCSGRCSGRVV